MGTWVLIIVTFTANSQPNPHAHTQEFSSKLTCELAKDRLDEFKTDNSYVRVKSTCVAK